MPLVFAKKSRAFGPGFASLKELTLLQEGNSWLTRPPGGERGRIGATMNVMGWRIPARNADFRRMSLRAFPGLQRNAKTGCRKLPQQYVIVAVSWIESRPGRSGRRKEHGKISPHLLQRYNSFTDSLHSLCEINGSIPHPAANHPIAIPAAGGSSRMPAAQYCHRRDLAIMKSRKTRRRAEPRMASG
jgi:hypothetical protein